MERNGLKIERAWKLLTKHYGSKALADDTLENAIDIARRSAWPCAEKVVMTIEKTLNDGNFSTKNDVEMSERLRKFVLKTRVAHCKDKRKF